MHSDVFVVIQDNNFGIDGCTHENSDGTYTIFINARLCTQRQYEVYQHEMYHINNMDFEKHIINEIEYKAHKGA